MIFVLGSQYSTVKGLHSDEYTLVTSPDDLPESITVADGVVEGRGFNQWTQEDQDSATAKVVDLQANATPIDTNAESSGTLDNNNNFTAASQEAPLPNPIIDQQLNGGA